MPAIAKVGDYAFSTDGGESYHGPYPTRDEAVDVAHSQYTDADYPLTITVGQVEAVPSGEECFGAAVDGYWVERIIEEAEEYLSDNYATPDERLSVSVEAGDDLEKALREAARAWAKRNDIWPNWFVVGTAEEVELKAKDT